MPDESTPLRCCEKFAKAIDRSGGMVYVDQCAEPATYNVQGCCENCTVLADLTHCPFCGVLLPSPAIPRPPRKRKPKPPRKRQGPEPVQPPGHGEDDPPVPRAPLRDF